MDAWTLPFIIPPGRTVTLTTLLELKELRPFLTLIGTSLKKEVIVNKVTGSAIVVSWGALRPGNTCNVIRDVWLNNRISRKTKAALWVVTMSTSLKSSKSAAKTKDFSLHNACMVAWISRHKGKAWLLAKHVARRQDEKINISHVCGLNMKLQSADGSELTVKAAHCRRHWVSILSRKVPKP